MTLGAQRSGGNGAETVRVCSTIVRPPFICSHLWPAASLGPKVNGGVCKGNSIWWISTCEEHVPSQVEALLNLPHNARSASLRENNGDLETSGGLGNLERVVNCGAFCQIVQLRSRYVDIFCRFGKCRFGIVWWFEEVRWGSWGRRGLREQTRRS